MSKKMSKGGQIGVRGTPEQRAFVRKCIEEYGAKVASAGKGGGACGCGSSAFSNTFDLHKMATLPTYMADECFDITSTTQQELFSAPKAAIVDFILSAARAGLQSPLSAAASIAQGAATLSLVEGAGLGRDVAGIYFEVAQSDNVNLGEVEFNIAGTLKSGAAYASGAFTGALKKPGRAGVVVLASQTAGSKLYPSLLRIEDDTFRVATVPAASIGGGNPAAPVILSTTGAVIGITVNVTAGPDGTTVKATTLSAAHAAWLNLVSKVA